MASAVRLRILFSAAILLFFATQTWAYTPPIGIPVPPAGFDAPLPALPSPWNADVPGYFYIKDGGSNSGNGYPGNPRGSVPSEATAAGSVIVIDGAYDSQLSMTFNGTASNPVFIMSSPTNQGILKHKWVLKGGYVVVDGLLGRWDNASGNGKLEVRGDHITVRNCDLRGDTGDGIGGMIVSGFSNVVVYNNEIQYGGNVNTQVDQDVHGITVGSGSYLWILENRIHHNSGNGMQVNGSSNSSIHHIYVGGNEFYQNAQAGIGIKASSDIIISQNSFWGARIRPWSGGNAVNIQYGPDYIWTIYNHMYDNEGGVMIRSDSVSNPGTEHFIIGNLIENTHKVTTSFNPENPWEMAAIGVWGGLNTYIINNTIDDFDAGVFSPRGRGKLEMYNNIFGRLARSDSYQVNTERSSDITNSPMDHNLYVGSVRVRAGSSSNIYDLGDLQSLGKEARGQNVSDAKFTNSANGDYSLLPSSPAQNAGVDHPVFDTFENRYGLSIRVDFNGTPRPASPNRWELGAFEIDSPPAPSNTVAQEVN